MQQNNKMTTFMLKMQHTFVGSGSQ